MSTERAALYRKRVAESELKATQAKAEESRRAWLIVAREWKKMAVREEGRLLWMRSNNLGNIQTRRR